MESAIFTVPNPPKLLKPPNSQVPATSTALPTHPRPESTISAFPVITPVETAWVGLRQSCLEWFSFGSSSIAELNRFAARRGLSVLQSAQPPLSQRAVLRHPTIPVRLHGTPFQIAVWQALLRIPHGHTVSYRYIARHLQRPKAVRAVAGAIAANPVAFFIPCHRVIGSSGALTGYRWGIPLKNRLLQCEQPENKLPSHLKKA